MRKKIKDIMLILFILFIVGIVFYFVNFSFNSPQEVRDYINGFGAFGPFIVIALITLEVILAPIPGAIISIGSGAAFGPFYGTLYTYIGNIIGTTIAFFLSRHFGRPLVKRFVKEQKLRTYDRFFKDKGVYGLWFVYIFPVFPTDILSFITGLSNIKFRKFFTIISIGYLPNMLILNIFGDSIIKYGFGTSTILIGSFLLLIFVIFYLYMVHYKKNIK
ncbi:TVP38/TMEM64 family protein [Candidatus Woesearchaeota archaeon]|jgi:uncharacterized membrane protein YdjX (TVP38/TMEM64 family)|nr:TVP38/TMEM64 family protein [Candidatus Woesearchaeota archaeon]